MSVSRALLAFELLAIAGVCKTLSARVTSTTEEKLNVHIIPHTHDDVGWTSTVDQYYIDEVQYILDTAVSQLLANKERKFIYVEIAFFMRWWREQTPELQDQVRQLVKNGQLELVNGGWCMNDEAAAHYNGIIDQMSLGLRFVEQNFGSEARPRVAWHIDPFGHSAEQATLFAMMGFDGFFVARIDYADRAKRWNETTMEMVWRGSSSLKEKSDLFTGVMYHHYVPPPGFCYDVKCSDPPIQDYPGLFDVNVQDRVAAFNAAAKDQAKKYATNNIMFTFGSDFYYMASELNYKNIDKLIKYVNQNGTVNAFYSTPSMYLDALHAAGKQWTVKTDDMFPYADAPFNYWSGYFSSRPAIKGYVRKMNNLLQACKQMEALQKGMFDTKLSSLTLQQAMGVAQHHDAVSGTEKQHVANDYAKRLHMGQVECTNLMGQALSALVTGDSTTMEFQYCEYLNISVCNATQNGSFSVAIYNPLGRKWSGIVRIPVPTDTVQVFSQDHVEIPTQVIPVSSATKAVRRYKGDAPYELIFEVAGPTALPPLGYTMFHVIESKRMRARSGERKFVPGVIVILKNEYTSVTIDGVSGLVTQIENVRLNQSTRFQQQFMWYNSSAGNNKNSTQKSGAYIFRPNNTNNEPYLVNPNGRAEIVNIYQGDLVQEVHQSFADSWLTQVVRVYKGIPGVEFEFTVGPVPISDGLGKEVISRFSTSLDNSGEWSTDANGRGMQLRKRNFRPTWKYNNTDPVAGNYFPVNSRIYMRDKTSNLQLTILNDRSQGGSSMKDGDLELMVHRRCLYDDDRGVGEPLNETGQFGDGLVIRGKHHILFDSAEQSTYWHRILGERMMMEPILFFAPSATDYSKMRSQFNFQFSGLAKDLPENVHLLTVEHLEDKKMLLRLENQFQADEPAPNDLNTNVIIDTKAMFSNIQVEEMTELSLGGNALLSSIKRLQWRTVPSNVSSSSYKGGTRSYSPLAVTDTNVALSPMDIRTFNVTFA